MLYQRPLTKLSSCVFLCFISITHAQMMEYNVIATLNQTLFKSMAVVVDNIEYPLESNTTYSVIFSGKAPTAIFGYQYAKVTHNPTDNWLYESILRSPQAIQSTPHEFFNRTWNTYSNSNLQFPQVYNASSARNRKVSLLHRHDEIPTIHITADKESLYLMHHANHTTPKSVDTTISYISLHDSFQFENVEISLAGRSSKLMAKLSYIFKLKKKDSLYGYRRIKLRSLAFDPSYMREQIGYNILSSTGVASTEFSYVRLLMNDQELGLFGLIEAFQNPWLANEFAGGDTSYKNGYLYQGNSNQPFPGYTSDLSYYKNNLTAYAGGQYKIKEEAKGGSKYNFQPLMDFTEFIIKAPVNSTEAVAIWNRALDVEGFLRAMAIEILGGYSDGYISNSNNFYIYQNPETDQMIYIPADLDICLGNAFMEIKNFSSGNYTEFHGWGERPLLRQIMLVKEFKDRFIFLLQDLNTKIFNIDIVGPYIDSLADMLREDIMWDKSLPGIAQDSMEAFLQNPPSLIRNNKALWDVIERSANKISFNDATNDLKSDRISYMGLKKWFIIIHQRTAAFFSRATAEL